MNEERGKEPINNFDEEEELGFKFDWATGKVFEHWLEVEGGKLRVRTEIAFFKTPDESGTEDLAKLK